MIRVCNAILVGAAIQACGGSAGASVQQVAHRLGCSSTLKRVSPPPTALNAESCSFASSHDLRIIAFRSQQSRDRWVRHQPTLNGGYVVGKYWVIAVPTNEEIGAVASLTGGSIRSF